MGLEGEDLQAAYRYMRTKPGAMRHVLQTFAIGNDPAPLKKYAMEFIAQRIGKGG